MIKSARFFLPCMLLFFSPMFYGCMGKQEVVNLYSLHTVATPAERSAAGNTSPFMVVMPVALAPQVNRSGPEFRLHPGRLESSPVNIWSEPLDRQITHILTLNLDSLLGPAKVSTHPGPRFARYHYQLEVAVSEFTVIQDRFQLRAIWTLSDRQQKEVIQHASFLAAGKVEPGDYLDYVDTGSLLLGQLSKEITNFLRSIQ